MPNAPKSPGLPQVTIDTGGQKIHLELGDQNAFDQFYQGIGYAVNVWAHIDRKLFECVHFTLGASERKTAIIYYRLKSQSERIAMTHDLMKATELGKLSQEWQELYAEIKRLSPLRNILAHQPLLGSSIIQNVSHIDPANPVRVEHFLSVEIEEKELLRGERKPRKVELGELIEHCRHVEALHQRAIKFASDLKASLLTTQPSGQLGG